MFWNEFLFAREFEYETPLSPDEIEDELKKLETRQHKSWFLSRSNLVHRVEYDGIGDKAGDFTIQLESADQHKWWGSKVALLQSEGRVRVNQDTGFTLISGHTRFNRRYYMLFLFMFGVNFVAQSMNESLFFQYLWIAIIIVFWYGMYRERNKLSDHIDDIIMNAKSQESIANLIDEELDVEWDAERKYMKAEYRT